MNWAARFRIGQYVRGSLWVLPLLGRRHGAVLGSIDVLVDECLTLPQPHVLGFDREHGAGVDRRRDARR